MDGVSSIQFCVCGIVLTLQSGCVDSPLYASLSTWMNRSTVGFCEASHRLVGPFGRKQFMRYHATCLAHKIRLFIILIRKNADLNQ